MSMLSNLDWIRRVPLFSMLEFTLRTAKPGVYSFDRWAAVFGGETTRYDRVYQGLGNSLVLACPSLPVGSTRGLNDRVPDVPSLQVVTLDVSDDEVHPFVNGRQLDEAIVIESVAAPESVVAGIAEQLALRGFRATTRPASAE